MKLWILRPLEFKTQDMNLHGLGSGPWSPWYDKSFGFVVRADSETEARLLAAENCSGEGENAWLDEKLSFCEILGICPASSPPGIVMNDFHAA